MFGRQCLFCLGTCSQPSAGEIGLGVGDNQKHHFGESEFKIRIKITRALEHPSWYFPSACLWKNTKRSV